jgi:hypothetical protein
MKNLLILIVFGVAGYFAYQYYIGPSLNKSTPAAPAFNMYSLPEECQRHGESLKDAFNRHKAGQINQVSVNGFTQNFRRCLRKAGYSDSQIDEAYEGIRTSG